MIMKKILKLFILFFSIEMSFAALEVKHPQQRK